MPPAVKTRLIVLHLTKYSDSSAVIHAVDSQYGRRSFLVRGIRNSHRNISDFHPLNILEAVSGESPKSSLSYLKEWKTVIPLESILSDIFKRTIAMFLSEVIYRSLRNEDSDQSLFGWMCDAIACLEAAEGNIANFHLWFLVAYCSKMGFRPNGKVEPAGIFNPEEEDLFDRILHSELEDTLAIKLTSSFRRAFSKKMIQYLSYHLGTEINIRSLDVLHEIFA